MSNDETSGIDAARVEAIDALPVPEAGKTVRGTLTSSHPALAGLRWPFTVARGAQDGPRVAIMSGVHPTEYPAIEAAIRVGRDLDATAMAGTVILLPLVNVPSFLSRTPFVSPLDGKNPNRVFPGDPGGTVTEVLADFIFRTVVTGADALIDLHGGDMVEDLTPCIFFTRCGDPAVDDAAEALGRAFGLPLLVPGTASRGRGTTDQAAAAAGIPAILTESGARGLLTEPETALHVEGVRRALRHLGVLPGGPPEEVPVTVTGDYGQAVAPAEGMWYPAVRPGDDVREGQVLGEIRDLFGDHLADVRSPLDGVVLYLTSSPAISVGGLAVGLARL